ncbi:TPA: adenylosuccinate lyase [archaeon]|nr:adenylosuccinate lyase [Candidatus Undinarchaeales archaeon SRR5007147.bin71]
MSERYLENHHTTEEMEKIFSNENILEKWLSIEAALAKAQASVGNIPKKAADTIGKNANLKTITLERVGELEEDLQHRILAVSTALAEKSGEYGKYVHLGATSYDIIDTGWALIFAEGLGMIEKRLKNLRLVLLDMAKQYRDLIIIGRTHGQHAVPTTLGFKFAIWSCEIDRQLERVERSRKNILFGKMTGAVGTGASFGKNAAKIQDLIMKDFGLKSPRATTQVVQRDRHADVIFTLVMIGQTLQKISTEIRNMQRTEVGELGEPFKKGKVSSAGMPQKRNPWRSERISGIVRYLRSNIVPALENIPLEHERDLTNSSCESIIFPETFILTDFIVEETIQIMQGLNVYPDKIHKNIMLTKGRFMAEAVMLKLVEKGMERSKAHEIMKESSMESSNKDIEMMEVLKKKPKIRELLSEDELSEVLDPKNYIGSAKTQIDKIIRTR